MFYKASDQDRLLVTFTSACGSASWNAAASWSRWDSRWPQRWEWRPWWGSCWFWLLFRQPPPPHHRRRRHHSAGRWHTWRSSTNGEVLLPVIFMFLIRLEYFICVSMFKSQGLLWLLTQAGVWIHLVSLLWTRDDVFRKTRLCSNAEPATWLTWVSTLCFVQSWQQIFLLEGQKNSYFVDTEESIFSPGILEHLWLLDAEFCVSAIVCQRDHSLADVTFLSVAGKMSRTLNTPISGCEHKVRLRRRLPDGAARLGELVLLLPRPLPPWLQWRLWRDTSQ